MRRSSLSTALLLPSFLLLVGCDGGGSGNHVATAGDFRLGVEDAARMVAPFGELPAEPGLVEALADFWMDYALLAWAVNQEGELDRVDFSSLVRQQSNQEMVMRLRDQVIDVDTVVTDEDLEAYYEEHRPGEQVRARHVLLLRPDNASPAEVDAVRRQIVEIRDRAQAGNAATFAELARTYSDDEGSAQRGGDLDWFPRGMMVPEFENVAFSLEPGEVSDVVETAFGFHVIRVEDRMVPDLDEIWEELRYQIQMERSQVAEADYVTRLEEPARIEITSDALTIVREMARSPRGRLSARAAERVLVRYEGGAYTAGEYREFLLFQSPQIREQIQEAPDEPIEDMLRSLARSELLVEEARRHGISVSPEEEAEMVRNIQDQYRALAAALGLSGITPRNGESMRDAVDREVKALMHRLVRGEQELIPLGTMGAPLRNRWDSGVSQGRVSQTVSRISQLRAEGYRGDAEAAPAPFQLPDQMPEGFPTPEPEPDTGAEGQSP